MRFHKIVPHLASAAVLASPFVVFAQGIVPTVPTAAPGTPISTLGQFLGFFCVAGNVLFSVVLLLSVVILLYAAFMFLTGGGDEERTTQARRWLTYAVVGIVVALVAKGIVLVVANSLGAAAAPQCA